MTDNDYDGFSALLDDVAELLRPNKDPMSGTARAMYFRALRKYTIEQVRFGFDAHMRDAKQGRFMPMPADVIAQIEGQMVNDGRPGPEEAWATGLRSSDENETVIWTRETSRAMEVARVILDRGDEVGARMAFKEAYSRLVEDARSVRDPVCWVVSYGFDTERRNRAISDAVSIGRLPAPEHFALTAPSVDVLAKQAPADVLQKLMGLVAKIRAGVHTESQDAKDKRYTEELRKKSDDACDAYIKQVLGGRT